MNEKEIVFPGDRLATEEEMVPANNVFVEKGNIYSHAVGQATSADGRLSIESPYKEIKKISRGMTVLGTVVGVLPAVVFLTIDILRLGKVVYVPIKDGKIVTKSERRDIRRPDFRSRDRDAPMEEFKLCGMGDVVIARVFRDDEDNYELSIRNPDDGVVFAKCESCGVPLVQKEGGLSCPKCKRSEQRKISTLYGNPEAIKAHLSSKPDVH